MKNLFVKSYPGYPRSKEADCPPHLAHDKKGTAGAFVVEGARLQNNVYLTNSNASSIANPPPPNTLINIHKNTQTCQ